MVEGDDRKSLRHKNRFCVGEKLKAFGGVGFGQGLIQKRVVVGVGPACPIIPATRYKTVQKSVWVVVIPNPT